MLNNNYVKVALVAFSVMCFSIAINQIDNFLMEHIEENQANKTSVWGNKPWNN